MNSLFIKLAIYLLFNFVTIVYSYNETGKTGRITAHLSPIWGENQYVDDENLGSYRILSEIQLSKSKTTFILEEWLYGPQRQFRMDVIELDTNKRKTILVNGDSNKTFYYEPFTCLPIIDLTKSNLSSELVEKFPQYYHNRLTPQALNIIVGGISSIWFYAMSLKNLTFTPAISSLDVSSRKTAKRVLKGYDQLSFKPSDKFPYKIKFYSHENTVLASKTIDPRSVVAIHLIDSNSVKVSLRAKIIELDISRNLYSEFDDNDFFDLPLGYGCQVKEPLVQNYKPPENFFTQVPHVFNLDVVHLSPSRYEHDIDKWQVHSSSLRLVSGQLQGRQYFAIEKHEYTIDKSKNDGQLSSGKRATLMRTKRVWDLGSSVSSDEKRASMYYEIDQQSGRCLNYGDGHLDEIASLEFTILTDDGQQISSGLTLDTKMIEKLFFDTNGYHLVQESKAKYLRSREIVYEKREQQFQLRNTNGELVWTGPVSLVRRSTVFDFDHVDSINDKLTYEDCKVHVSIYLFTKAFDKVLGLIQLTAKPGRLVDGAYFHRELNIDQCLSLANNFGPKSIGKNFSPPNSLNFKLSYSLEVGDKCFEHISKDGHIEEIIYEKFLSSAMMTAKNQLDLLQVQDLVINIDKESVTISGQMLEWPHLFYFHRQLGRKIVKSTGGASFWELKQNEAKCAESCVHYECKLFSYCRKSQMCELFLDDVNSNDGEKFGKDNKLIVEPDPECAVYTKRPDKNHSISPLEFIYRYKRAILAEFGDEQSAPKILLNLTFDDDDTINNDHKHELIVLSPTSITTTSQLIDNLGIDEGNAAYETRMDKSKTNILPDYEIILDNNRFKTIEKLTNDFPLQEASHVMEWNDCATLCEDNDCRSFSYCQIEKTCLISQLHKRKLIDQHVEQADACRLFGRNYLSKFQKVNLVPRPSAGIAKELKLGSQRDCAIECMEENEFRCKSFLYCPNVGQGYRANDCLLRKNRITKAKSLIDQTFIHLTNDKCETYSRSYLIDFDRFQGKQLNEEVVQGEIIVQMNLGAELCAAECAEMEESSCQAFHVCQGVAVPNRPICAIVSQPTDNQTRIKIDDLIETPKCTAFIVSRNSELYIGDTSNLSGESDSNALDQNLTDDTSMHIIVRWIVRLVTVLLGLVLGYSLAWLLVLALDFWRR